MKLFVINLDRADERRHKMKQQFEQLGLEVTFHRAVDARELTPQQYATVDRETRRLQGLWPQADGSVANWISQRQVMRDMVENLNIPSFCQRQVMRDMVENGTEIAAIFEDDAGLSPDLPEVLDALKRRPFDFDIIKLNRRSQSKPFLPVGDLTTGHRIGRVRYHDYGNEGYVITRDAARHFLENTPRMMWEIDQALPRFWENGLNVFYLDPPVVFHHEQEDSQIEHYRRLSRRKQKSSDRISYILWRRVVSAFARTVHRRTAFRRLMRGEIGVTRWPPDSGT